MPIDGEYDWSNDQYDDEDGDEDYHQHHKDIEADIHDQGQYYSRRVEDGAGYDERETRLNAMMSDLDEQVAQRAFRKGSVTNTS